MNGPEDNEQARELKALLCAPCYAAQLAWITGKGSVPSTFCSACVPLAMKWLEYRKRKRDSEK